MKSIIQLAAASCLLGVLLLAIPIQNASAGAMFSVHYQVLHSNQTNTVESGRLLLDIVNGGTETAINATVVIDTPQGAQFGTDSLSLGNLVPGAPLVQEVNFSFPPSVPLIGNPISIRIEYEDAAGNKLSSVVQGISAP